MLALHERNKIVGRAWEDSDSKGVSYVNTAVGFAFGSFSVSNDLKMVQELEQTVSSLSEKQEALLDHYRQTLNDQNEKINNLIQQLENKLNN